MRLVKVLLSSSLLLAVALVCVSSSEVQTSANLATNSSISSFQERVTASATSNATATAAWEFFSKVNLSSQRTNGQPTAEDYRVRLELARHHRRARQFAQATTSCVELLHSQAPDSIQRQALIELGQVAQDENNLTRAEQIYAQCLARWSQDAGVPELLLREGLLYRQMGLHKLAISKLYAVMTSALVLRTENFEPYQQLVLRAQNEIAQTQFDLANWAEAVDSLNRLLRVEPPPANQATLQYELIQSLVALGRDGEAIAQAQDFLNREAAAPERAEVHFLCASALRRAGRGGEALRQVLALLQEQRARGMADPATLSYWQRRAGNEIANRFYQEGDSLKALDIYLSLAALDPTPQWQLPAWYQIGLVFERLNQPGKAADYYRKILDREKEVPAEAPPSLKEILEMARWRKDFLDWRLKTELASRQFRSALGGSVRTNGPAAEPIP